jgi:hypothetical protein
MVIIQESGTSSVVFRLSKVSQYTQPYFIFQLQNQNSKAITTFTGNDVSNTPLSYNEFNFVNGVTFSATQSRFNLDQGNYFMSIYETPYQYDLNIASASLLYYGELKIEGQVIPDTIYYNDNDDNTIIYFE